MRQVQRFSRFFASVLAVFAVTCGLASPAAAQPARNVVVFGDSFTSNPDQYRHFSSAFLSSGSSTARAHEGYPAQGGCLQAPDNWPRLMQARTGLNVADYSCTGHASLDLPGRVDQAVRDGALGPRTRAVVLSIGINDYMPWKVQEAGTGYNADMIRDHYVANMRRAAGKVRAAAPQAKLIIPGMLSVSEDTGLQRLCTVNVVPNMPLGLPFPTVQRIENQNRDNQRAAADAIGATFIDLKERSRGHGTCAPDDQRWVAGLIDTTTPSYTMAFHPSREGSRFIAQQVAGVL